MYNDGNGYNNGNNNSNRNNNPYYNNKNNNPYFNNKNNNYNDDISEEIRRSVAASTDWINNVIDGVHNTVNNASYNPRPQYDPEAMRRRSEEQLRRQREIAERAKARQAERQIIGDIPGWLGIINFLVAGGFGLLTFWLGMFALFLLFDFSIFGGIACSAFALFNGYVTFLHGKRGAQIGRYSAYARFFKGKEYVSVDEIVTSLGIPKKKVLKDIKRMISDGILRQAHIDGKEQYVLMTNEVFNQYMNAQNSYEQRQKAEAAKTDEQIIADAKQKKSDELTETLNKGLDYMEQIKIANEAIPGEEISAKLTRLETVGRQIFQIVQDHPEKLPEIHKFMEYYLPTTLKLVKQYYEFDQQPVQGENIVNAKQEIEKTLDMINVAFENLSNKLYQNVAMDISTDSDVLRAMFSQDGLQDDGLTTKKK